MGTSYYYSFLGTRGLEIHDGIRASAGKMSAGLKLGSEPHHELFCNQWGLHHGEQGSLGHGAQGWRLFKQKESFSWEQIPRRAGGKKSSFSSWSSSSDTCRMWHKKKAGSHGSVWHIKAVFLDRLTKEGDGKDVWHWKKGQFKDVASKIHLCTFILHKPQAELKWADPRDKKNSFNLEK